MVSRKINELQLQREQPKRWRLLTLPATGKGSPSPSSGLASQRCSTAAPAMAEPPALGCTPQPGEQVREPPGQRGAAGQEQPPRGPELSHVWVAQGKGKHCSACPILSSRAPTNHGWCSAATLCPQHQRSQSPRLLPSPPYSRWPILAGTEVPPSATLAGPRRSRCSHGTTPAGWGLRAAPAPGCCLPRDAAAARAAGGREEGSLLLPRLPEN